MSDWSDALRAHASTISNRYNDHGIAYDLNNAATHVEQLQQQVEQLQQENERLRSLLSDALLSVGLAKEAVARILAKEVS